MAPAVQALVAHALDEVLLIEGQSFGPRDVLDVVRRLASVADRANRNQPGRGQPVRWRRERQTRRPRTLALNRRSSVSN
jgi:hypothetical protein